MRFYVKSIIADSPQLNAFMGHFVQRGNHDCGECCAPVKKTTEVICPTICRPRNYDIEVQMMLLRQSYIDKMEKGLNREILPTERHANTWCKKWSLAQCRVLPGLLGSPIPFLNQNALGKY